MNNIQVLSVEKDDDSQLVMAYRRCEYTAIIHSFQGSEGKLCLNLQIIPDALETCFLTRVIWGFQINLSLITTLRYLTHPVLAS